MAWQDKDNKKETGRMDRIWVSKTEAWEINYFIDHYLEKNNFVVSDENRKMVKDAIDTYPGKPPIKRDNLTKYLNQKIEAK